MPHNVGVMNALENMKEVLALYKKVIGNYRPLLDGERYLTDKEVAQILKVSRRTLQEYRNDGVIPYILLGGKVLSGYELETLLLHQSSPICFLLQFELPRFSLDCLYFRPNCVNLPKSLRFYKLFS
jgi:excisionase family DNA binding protein